MQQMVITGTMLFTAACVFMLIQLHSHSYVTKVGYTRSSHEISHPTFWIFAPTEIAVSKLKSYCSITLPSFKNLPFSNPLLKMVIVYSRIIAKLQTSKVVASWRHLVRSSK